MLLEIDEMQTARFNVVCAKLIGEPECRSDLAEIDRVAKTKQISMITTRVSVDEIRWVQNLEEDGFRLMDTLVYYGRKLDDIDNSKISASSMNICLASKKDVNGVAEIARNAFKDYMGHFHADPRLKNSAADAVYMDWAVKSVESAANDSPVVVAKKDGRIVGFLTAKLHDTSLCEVILNGVHPDAQQQGVYPMMFSFIMDYFKNKNANRIIVSTQINNYAVQKAWAGLGLTHYASYYTLHKWVP
jgi:ribosomal protein S18 acetylase RimI-like enzyme